ncbi:alkaline phosphatase [Natronorubrum thiooxidans]|uniref:Alkaline phosphatase n=2 Tax=Natronorubrum thiooxidans TaxID=308853 RepID=A0A1N7E404_9EURY|nr:alkaline phosphatase [Natronorubrum thiooxidans]
MGTLAAAGLLGSTGTTQVTAENGNQGNGLRGHPGVNNVIVLIGDGMGFDPIETTSTVYDDLTMSKAVQNELSMQEFVDSGFNRTSSRSGAVTDSAAAGTALATGLKAFNGQVGVYGPDGADSDELTTVMGQAEIAKAVGKQTGLVTTTRLTHATPATYATHVANRGQEGDIADQYLENEIDVLLGGGRREWDDDQLERAETIGYDVLYDRSDLQTADDGKLLGLFDHSHITYRLDRPDTIPSLPEMTAAAVDRLESEEGYFLMVEGGRIDHAEHGNDVQTTVDETKEFDEVVEWTLEYAADRDDTLVVVTSDHETGGMATGTDYGAPIARKCIKNASASCGAIAERIENGESARAVIEETLDVTITAEEATRIENERGSDGWALSDAVAEITADYLGVGWASTRHTGPAQLVVAAGLGDGRFTGWFDNTDLSATITALMLFGDSLEMPEGRDLERWEQRIKRNGPRGPRDAYIACVGYVGPVETAVQRALDTTGDGIVDYGDVLAIADGQGRPEPATQPRNRGRDRAANRQNAIHQF